MCVRPGQLGWVQCEICKERGREVIPRYCELAVSAVTVRYGAWEQSGESGEL